MSAKQLQDYESTNQQRDKQKTQQIEIFVDQWNGSRTNRFDNSGHQEKSCRAANHASGNKYGNVHLCRSGGDCQQLERDGCQSGDENVPLAPDIELSFQVFDFFQCDAGDHHGVVNQPVSDCVSKDRSQYASNSRHRGEPQASVATTQAKGGQQDIGRNREEAGLRKADPE